MIKLRSYSAETYPLNQGRKPRVAFSSTMEDLIWKNHRLRHVFCNASVSPLLEQYPIKKIIF